MLIYHKLFHAFYQLETAVDIQGNNALHYACWGGRLQIVKTLIEIRHFDPLLRNSEGLSAIQFATAGKHVDLVQYLAHRCSRNLASESSDSGYNSLHRAAIYNSLTTIKLLLLSMSETGEGNFCWINGYLDTWKIVTQIYTATTKQTVDTVNDSSSDFSPM